MFKILKGGTQFGMTEAPSYIKKAKNGCYILCSEPEASGIVFSGTPYQLAGRPEMGDVETVTVEAVSYTHLDVYKRQFLDTADENGVSVWERELRIYPKDTDSMEVRKARIKAMWNLELPYTVPWLRNWLAGLCGATGYELTVSGYVVNIQLDYNALPNASSLAGEILDMLLAVRPCNMLVLMTAFLQTYGTITHGAYTEQSSYMEIWPQIISELESQGAIVMAGPLEYHACVEIYPKEE